MPWYNCQYCKAGWNTPYELKRHERVHYRFKCKFRTCYAKFKHQHELIEHQVDCHTVKCYCGEGFPDQHKLTEHQQRNHTDKHPFPCNKENCSASYPTLRKLRRHIRTAHTNKGRFQCDYEGCRAGFSEMYRLKRHQVCHADARPYRCGICGMRFKLHETIKAHQVTEQHKPVQLFLAKTDRLRRYYRKTIKLLCESVSTDILTKWGSLESLIHQFGNTKSLADFRDGLLNHPSTRKSECCLKALKNIFKVRIEQKRYWENNSKGELGGNDFVVVSIHPCQLRLFEDHESEDAATDVSNLDQQPSNHFSKYTVHDAPISLDVFSKRQVVATHPNLYCPDIPPVDTTLVQAPKSFLEASFYNSLSYGDERPQPINTFRQAPEFPTFLRDVGQQPSDHFSQYTIHSAPIPLDGLSKEQVDESGYGNNYEMVATHPNLYFPDTSYQAPELPTFLRGINQQPSNHFSKYTVNDAPIPLDGFESGHVRVHVPHKGLQ